MDTDSYIAELFKNADDMLEGAQEVRRSFTVNRGDSTPARMIGAAIADCVRMLDLLCGLRPRSGRDDKVRCLLEAVDELEAKPGNTEEAAVKEAASNYIERYHNGEFGIR